MKQKTLELQPPLDELIQAGRALRKQTPRSSHAEWKTPHNRADPIEMLISTSQSRLSSLLPLRYGRMSASPFAFMRGTPYMMGADLAKTPLTGILIQICGDCHLGNFGAFASPERRLLFDITDFDETIPGPWEFDLKRLAVSFILLSTHNGYNADVALEVTSTMLAAYRTRMKEFATMSPLDVWYYIIDSEILIHSAHNESTRKRRVDFEKKARMRTADKLMEKLMVERDGKVQFIENLPTIRRLDMDPSLENSFRTALANYPLSLAEDRRSLFSRYRLDDLAFKVVGVGSVGTRCGIALYVSQSGHKLLLQIKEACRSVIEPFVNRSQFVDQGQRVVVGQRLMQCASDIFLGWANGHDGHCYYIRQLRDMKTNLDTDELKGEVLYNFADMCGWALARAHAKSGEAPLISGYIGNSDALDVAIADFAMKYAKQCEKDYDHFKKAIRDGKINIELESK